MNKKGNSILHLAFQSNENVEIIKFLIKIKELDLKLKNDFGNTPIFFALGYNKSPEVVKYICDNLEFNIYETNYGEESILLFAVQCNENIEVLKFLFIRYLNLSFIEREEDYDLDSSVLQKLEPLKEFFDGENDVWSTEIHCYFEKDIRFKIFNFVMCNKYNEIFQPKMPKPIMSIIFKKYASLELKDHN